jgi:hypothetical protein
MVFAPSANSITLDAIARAAALRQASGPLFGADALLMVLDVAFPDYDARRTLVSTAFRNATAPLKLKPREDITVKEAGKWLGAALAQAVRLDPSPAMQYSALEAVRHSAHAVGFDFHLDPAEGSIWTCVLAKPMQGKAVAVQRLLEKALVPSRARAFNELPRHEALQAFPELSRAYAQLDALWSGVRPIPRVFGAARIQMYKALRTGWLPRAKVNCPGVSRNCSAGLPAANHCSDSRRAVCRRADSTEGRPDLWIGTAF